MGPALSAELEKTKVGIICLTADNLNAQWILFEAGALSKTVQSTFVCPFLFRLERSDVEGPLAQFQSTKAEKDDMRQLVHTINRALGSSALKEGALDQVFEKWWPDLEERLGRIPTSKEATSVPKRTDRQLLEEILESVRSIPRTVSYSAAALKTEAEDQRLASIKSILFDQSKRFLSSCLDHLVGFRIEDDGVHFIFDQKDSLYADLLKAREQKEALVAVCARVLGEPVRVFVELHEMLCQPILRISRSEVSNMNGRRVSGTENPLLEPWSRPRLLASAICYRPSPMSLHSPDSADEESQCRALWCGARTTLIAWAGSRPCWVKIASRLN